MKKIVIALLMVVMSTTMLVGCGSQSSAKEDNYKQAEAEAPKREPNPILDNDFTKLFPYDFSATLDDYEAYVRQNGFEELPTINHSYAFTTVAGDLSEQIADVLTDPSRKSYYLDFDALGDLVTVVIRFNTDDDLGSMINQKYGPKVDGEYLGNIGGVPLSLIVYKKEDYLGIEKWEVSISTQYQNR